MRPKNAQSHAAPCRAPVARLCGGERPDKIRPRSQSKSTTTLPHEGRRRRDGPSLRKSFKKASEMVGRQRVLRGRNESFSSRAEHGSKEQGPARPRYKRAVTSRSARCGSPCSSCLAPQAHQSRGDDTSSQGSKSMFTSLTSSPCGCPCRDQRPWCRAFQRPRKAPPSPSRRVGPWS